jgi:Zn finger protein HypA/HybF involved in hydrogenase expression
MHEYLLVKDMLRNIEAAARAQHALRVVDVHVRIGSLSGVTAEGLHRNFETLSRGTLAECACLEVDVCSDRFDPLACEVVLKSIQVEVRNEASLVGAALYND